MELVDLVGLGREEAVALLGHHMDHHRARQPVGQVEGPLDRALVVAVDGPGVLDAQVLEEDVGRDQLLHPGLEPLGHLVGRLPDRGDGAEETADTALGGLVAGVQAQPGEVVGQPPHRGGVGAAVVIEDDGQVGPERADVVERLVGHAPGQRAVAHHHHHLARLGPPALGLGQSQGVAEAGGGMAVLDQVVGRFRPAGVAGEAARLPQGGELVPPTGQDLVDVGLVAGVEDDLVGGAVVDAVEGQGQLHHPQVGAQVAPGEGDLLHQEVPYFRRQLTALLLGEVAAVGGAPDSREHRAWHPSGIPTRGWHGEDYRPAASSNRPGNGRFEEVAAQLGAAVLGRASPLPHHLLMGGQAARPGDWAHRA